MKTTVTVRHMDISDAIRAHATEKVEKMVRIFDKLVGVDVILDESEGSHSAELILHQIKGPQIVAEAKHADMHTALDNVITKMETQLRKKKGLLIEKRKQQ